MAKLLFVCLGNICRSPMAEFVMKSITDQHHIESRATSSWEHGNPIYPGTQGISKKPIAWSNRVARSGWRNYNILCVIFL